MHKAFIASTFLISCTIITSVSYAKDCDIEHYNFVFGQDTSTHMTVKAVSLAARPSPRAAVECNLWQYRSLLKAVVL